MFCFRLYCMISWVMAMVVKLVWGSVFFLLFFVFMGSTWRVLELCNLWLLWCFISLHLRHIYIHNTLPFVYFYFIFLSIQPFIILTTCSTQSHKHWSLSKLILGYTLVHHHEAKTERLTTTHLQLTITRKFIFPRGHVNKKLGLLWRSAPIWSIQFCVISIKQNWVTLFCLILILSLINI